MAIGAEGPEDLYPEIPFPEPDTPIEVPETPIGVPLTPVAIPETPIEAINAFVAIALPEAPVPTEAVSFLLQPRCIDFGAD